MQTPYEEHNGAFSEKAHLAAQKSVYPLFFETKKLRFENTTMRDNGANSVYDVDKAVDRIVYVDCELRGEIKFTIQERFRRPVTESGFRAFEKRDITITEWNHNSNSPAELYKFECDYLVYGYFNEKTGNFGEVEVISIPRLKYQIVKGKIPATLEKNKKNQSFFCFPFDALEQADITVWKKKFY